MDKINVYDKIIIENQKKGKNMGVKEILHKPPSKISFANGIHTAC